MCPKSSAPGSNMHNDLQSDVLAGGKLNRGMWRDRTVFLAPTCVCVQLNELSIHHSTVPPPTREAPSHKNHVTMEATHVQYTLYLHSHEPISTENKFRYISRSASSPSHAPTATTTTLAKKRRCRHVGRHNDCADGYPCCHRRED